MLYRAYNLYINSPFKIPLLKKLDCKVTKSNKPLINLSIDHSIDFPDKSYETYTSHNTRESIYYRKNIGIFKICKDSIKINPSEHVTKNDLPRVLLGLPFGYLLTLNENVAFHGSAVSRYNDSYLFLGKSGMGKSTLAYNLVEDENFSFITEDICAVSNLSVKHSFPMIKISSNLYKQENKLNKNFFEFEEDSLGRSGYLLEQNKISKSSTTLKACFILQEQNSSKVQIKELPKSISIKYLLSNMFKAHPFNHDKDLLNENINQAKNIASKIKCYGVYFSKSDFNERNKRILNFINKIS